MQFSKITIFAYVNLLRVIDHKIKIPTFGHKHNLLSRNQSKVRTVGYGGGRVYVPSFISSPINVHVFSFVVLQFFFVSAVVKKYSGNPEKILYRSVT